MASSVDLVVHLSVDSAGRRRVTEIVGVPGRVENDVIEVQPIFERVEQRLVWTGGLPPHLERFERAGVDLPALLDPRGATVGVG